MRAQDMPDVDALKQRHATRHYGHARTMPPYLQLEIDA